ncbi:MAG: hypothetical protein A2583_08230 [Bdellovibrionales bacterium RIFOXYD1_FULL_53_11]|nr:MAG: hypothetical protein A2583_08230 [Bdellovibrionales bacterium RIFOXYD1_FULL_53_11]
MGGSSNFKKAVHWFASGKGADTDCISGTRDVFQARLERTFRDVLKSGMSGAEAALLVSVTGEIGNNAFDHNIGQWQDQSGCWFEMNKAKNGVEIIIADRGRGFLESLKRVQTDLTTDQAAIEIAFEKIISGRSPEKRGNGLKYVRAIINGHAGRGVVACCGKGLLKLGGHAGLAGAEKELEKISGKGVLAMIFWKTGSC